MPESLSYPTPRLSESNGSSQGTDLRQLLHTLGERAWIILSVLVAVTLLTVAYIHRAPRIFAATAVLQVEQQEQRILKFEKVVQEDLRSTETIRTILQTLKTRLLLERVAATNRLLSNPLFAEPAPKTLTDAAAALSKITTVRLRPGTRLIDVTVEHTSPALAMRLANTLVEEFIRFGFEQDTATSQLATEGLMREAERLKRKLSDSETALQRYVVDSRAVSLEERQNTVIPKLKDLNTKLTEAKSGRLKQEAEFARLQEFGTNVHELLTLTPIANDPTVVGLNLNLSKLEGDFSTLRQRYRQEHPKYIQMESQLADLRESLRDAVLRAALSMALAFENAQAAEQALATAVTEQEQAALTLNQQAIQYGVLSREVDSDRAMYDTVLSRLKETALTKDLATYKVRIVEPAIESDKPIKPKKQKILLLGLVLGSLAGVGLALGINALDNSFKTVDQTEDTLGMPVLATIPIVRELDGARNHVVVEENSNSANAEAFRSLRASLSMLGRAEDRQVFLFTSALPQEGKTFCSVNYALSLSQQGLRTLLIDCDLRRPNVEQSLFGTRRTQFGVSDFLTGKKTLDEVLSTSEHDNLSVIGVGQHAPNPSELLAQGRLAALIEQAKRQFDRIIIDSAPIQAVSDTLLILEGVQTVCLTVRAGRTPRKAASRALQTLKQANAPVAGILLNCLRRRKGGGYYYGYDSYSYYSVEAPPAAKSARANLRDDSGKQLVGRP